MALGRVFFDYYKPHRGTLVEQQGKGSQDVWDQVLHTLHDIRAQCIANLV